MKIFGLFESSGVKVTDVGLKRYITLETKIVPKTRGKLRERFEKAKVNLVERLINQLCVPGHRGKKHKLITRVTGKWTKNAKVVIEALKRVEKETKQNPLQVFVKAVENAAPRDEITVIEYGGARYPQAVDTAPSRRLSLALRYIVHSAFDRSFNKKVRLPAALASELILASQNNPESGAIAKKQEIEKQADSAR